jgi:sugar/nucleoside kinase (ribokinase family)
VDYDLVACSRLFHFGYPPLMARMFAEGGAELETMFRRVKGLGVMTSLDMTLPDPQGPAGAVDWRALLARVLPYVDVFTPSLEELLYMLAPDEWAARVADAGDRDLLEVIPAGRDEELAAEALGLGARIVFLKAGSRGAYLRTGEVAGLPLDAAAWTDYRLRVSALPLDATRFRNACGAGDAAVAGLLLALLRNEGPDAAARLAMRAGRDSLYGVDTTSGLVPWEQMQAADRRG